VYDDQKLFFISPNASPAAMFDELLERMWLILKANLAARASWAYFDDMAKKRNLKAPKRLKKFLVFCVFWGLGFCF